MALQPKEVKSFLKQLIDPYLTREMIEDFVDKHKQDFEDKRHIDFDYLYALMKPSLLYYKSLYEVRYKDKT